MYFSWQTSLECICWGSKSDHSAVPNYRVSFSTPNKNILRVLNQYSYSIWMLRLFLITVLTKMRCFLRTPQDKVQYIINRDLLRRGCAAAVITQDTCWSAPKWKFLLSNLLPKLTSLMSLFRPWQVTSSSIFRAPGKLASIYKYIPVQHAGVDNLFLRKQLNGDARAFGTSKTNTNKTRTHDTL